MINKLLKEIFANVVKVIRKIKLLYNYLANYLEILCNNVDCKGIPKIEGRIVINNKGRLLIGSGVSFRCALTSNFVGLYKPVTIFVQTDSVLSIGNNSGFSGVSIYCSKEIVIGNYVNCGGNVSIWDTDFHPLLYSDRRIHKLDSIKSSPINIEDDVFIGANSIILKGVNIGARSIVGAGSVVTKSIPCDEVWAGNPAKFIKSNLNA